MVLFSCSNGVDPSSNIKDRVTSHDTEVFEGLVFHDGKLYSGVRYKEYKAGKKHWEVKVLSGRMNGSYSEWFRSGAVRVLQSYKANKRVGKSKTYWDINNDGEHHLRETGTYSNNKKTGAWYYYHQNGQLHYKDSLDQGSRILEGRYIFYYSNGKKEKVLSYKEGKPDGVWSCWYEDGGLKSEGVYSNGRENGKFKVWHYNRQLMRVETLSNGRRTGTSFVYDASGNVIEKKTYK